MDLTNGAAGSDNRTPKPRGRQSAPSATEPGFPDKSATSSGSSGPLPPLPRRQSLVAQTVAFIKDQIQTGAWQEHFPSERKLCELLGVSRVTLRAALALLQRERLLEKDSGRRRRVMKQQRQALLAGARKNVILLTPAALHQLPPFEMYWIDHLREQLGEAGYHLEVHYQQACYGPRAPHALEELAQAARPAGWVLYRSTAPMQQWMSDRALPCVITGSRHGGVALPSVDLDHRALCRHAAGLLLARGHTRLAFVNPKSGLAGDLESEEGFKEGATAGGAQRAQVVIGHHDGSRENLCLRLNELLVRSAPPTGFLVSGSRSALTTLCFLMHRGLKLPKDVALISRNHDSFLEEVVPSIARYSCDPTLMARKISRTVLQLVRGDAGEPRPYHIMPRFVPGQTLG